MRHLRFDRDDDERDELLIAQRRHVLRCGIQIEGGNDVGQPRSIQRMQLLPQDIEIAASHLEGIEHRFRTDDVQAS